MLAVLVAVGGTTGVYRVVRMPRTPGVDVLRSGVPTLAALPLGHESRPFVSHLPLLFPLVLVVTPAAHMPKAVALLGDVTAFVGPQPPFTSMGAQRVGLQPRVVLPRWPLAA